MTTSSTPCKPLEGEDVYPSALLLITATFVFAIGLVGTLGNLLAVMSMVSNAKLRKRGSTAFMINLPACLIPVCIIGMPLFGTGIIQQYLYGCIIFPEWVIVSGFAVCLTLGQVHIHSICALAFNRLVAVVWPTWYKRLMKPAIVSTYIAIIWIYSALLWIPLATGIFGQLQYVPEELMVSMVDKTNSRGKKGLHVFITYFLPILFITVCYIIMYRKVRHIRHETRERRVSVVAMSDSNAIRQWEDHVTRTILCIYAVLISCSIPHLVIHILHLHKQYKSAWLLLHVVFWLQFCLDPIIYIIFSRVYRKATLEYLSKIFPTIGIFQLQDDIPKSNEKSDGVNTTKKPYSPTYASSLRPPVQKVEFSSEVHRDLLDPKIIPDKS